LFLLSGIGMHTIINSDLILVMGRGGCLEFGAPRDLLAYPSGVFRSMWEEELRGQQQHEQREEPQIDSDLQE